MLNLPRVDILDYLYHNCNPFDIPQIDRGRENKEVSFISTSSSDLLMPKLRGFKIASLNIASLPKHIDELRIVMSNNEIDVLAINESRMDSTITNDMILIYGYSWVGKHRNRSGGGMI